MFGLVTPPPCRLAHPRPGSCTAAPSATPARPARDGLGDREGPNAAPLPVNPSGPGRGSEGPRRCPPFRSTPRVRVAARRGPRRRPPSGSGLGLGWIRPLHIQTTSLTTWARGVESSRFWSESRAHVSGVFITPLRPGLLSPLRQSRLRRERRVRLLRQTAIREQDSGKAPDGLRRGTKLGVEHPHRPVVHPCWAEQ